MVCIENNIELGQDLTRNEITDLLFPPVRSTPAHIQDPITEGDLDQNEFLLENLSVGNPPHRTGEGYHDIYPHEYVKSWKEKSQERCHYKFS